jgi:hypothetical protein
MITLIDEETRKVDLKKLREPFSYADIEWRISQCGMSQQKQPWAKCLAYITNRAIMERLDEVIGVDNWKNEFISIDGGFLCGISLNINGNWITKWDGSQETKVESTKGGISGSMKRAAVQWGMGRYLYGLESNWANIVPDGIYSQSANQKAGTPFFKWNPPELPSWALPENEKSEKKPRKKTPQPAGKSGNISADLDIREEFKKLYDPEKHAKMTIDWRNGTRELSHVGSMVDQAPIEAVKKSIAVIKENG